MYFPDWERNWRKEMGPFHLLAITVAGFSAFACASPEAYKAQRNLPLGRYVFIANTSPIDFDDLWEVNDRSRFEGFFDRAYPSTCASLILNSQVLSDHQFTPEAEWAIFIHPPLKGSESIDALMKRQFAFVPMIEGKFVDELQSRNSNSWQPASGMNNLYAPAGEWTEKRPLAAWSRLLRNDESYDRMAVLVEHTDAGGQLCQFVGTFGDMRRDLFAARPLAPWRRPLDLEELVTRTAAEFLDIADGKPSVQLLGINLGAHGSRAALVNDPDRRYRRAPLPVLTSYLFHPVGEQASPRIRTMHRIAKGIASDRAWMTDACTLKLQRGWVQ